MLKTPRSRRGRSSARSTAGLWMAALALSVTACSSAVASGQPGTSSTAAIATSAAASPAAASTETLTSGGPVATSTPSVTPTDAATPTPSPMPVPSFAPPGKFVPTGSMTTGRSSHTATLLNGGRVLIAGGEGSGAFTSAEVYDPTSGKFTRTGSLRVGREDQTATLLKDGRVLLTGGIGRIGKNDWGDLDSAELYDPATGTFTLTGSMMEGRCFHTATLLQDGRVLIAGGRGGPNVGSAGTPSAELYDPATGKFTPVGSMTIGHMFHTATLMNDGRVLIAGGNGDNSAEIYDPASATFRSIGAMPSVNGWHVAALLSDGRVLVAGQGNNGSWADIYYPETGTFRTAAPMLHDCNCSGGLASPSAAFVLKDGRVLAPDFAVSPTSSSEFVGSVELFDPLAGTFTQASAMARMRWGMSMTLLADGRVLFAGDQGAMTVGGGPTLSPKAAAANDAARASAELYVP